MKGCSLKMKEDACWSIILNMIFQNDTVFRSAFITQLLPCFLSNACQHGIVPDSGFITSSTGMFLAHRTPTEKAAALVKH